MELWFLDNREWPQRVLGHSCGDKAGATRGVNLQRQENEWDVMAPTVGAHTRDGAHRGRIHTWWRPPWVYTHGLIVAGGLAPFINLGTRWRRVVSSTLRPLSHQRKGHAAHWIGGWWAPRGCRPFVEEKYHYLAAAGNWTKAPRRSSA